MERETTLLTDMSMDANWYCSATHPWIAGLCCVPRTCEDQAALEAYCYTACANRHRKWPTPKQFREEYEVPWAGAAYRKCFSPFCSKEACAYMEWSDASAGEMPNACCAQMAVVCAATPYGKPPENWRPG